MIKNKVTIVGGLGHIGLPLGIVLANKGFEVCLYDINNTNFELVMSGKMPFIEYGVDTLLGNALNNKTLSVSSEKDSLKNADYVIIAIGTPVDEYMNPKTRQFLNLIYDLKEYLNKDQTIIIRSTVYPKTVNRIQKILGGNEWKIAYCPERIAQGYAIEELGKLPQVVSGVSEDAIQSASELFSKISPKIINTTVQEAELIKLFTNAWRYIQFAVTNQFYMISSNFGVDYGNLRKAMVDGYGRAAQLPTAGFAAGPCLLKDTMQLAAFDATNFLIGHAAMMINEGLPNFIVENLLKHTSLEDIKVGILGMAFKADIDDPRDSLSYKLGKILRFHGADVYYSDEFIKDTTFITKETLINECSIIIIGVPHSAYKDISFPKEKTIVDLWEIYNSENILNQPQKRNIEESPSLKYSDSKVTINIYTNK